MLPLSAWRLGQRAPLLQLLGLAPRRLPFLPPEQHGACGQSYAGVLHRYPQYPCPQHRQHASLAWLGWHWGLGPSFGLRIGMGQLVRRLCLKFRMHCATLVRRCRHYWGHATHPCLLVLPCKHRRCRRPAHCPSPVLPPPPRTTHRLIATVQGRRLTCPRTCHCFPAVISVRCRQKIPPGVLSVQRCHLLTFPPPLLSS